MTINSKIKSVTKSILPYRYINTLKKIFDKVKKNNNDSTIGKINFGDLRRVKPISKIFGYDRNGTRIGRYYIDKFLSDRTGDIYGRVLEIADNDYTLKYGGNRVTQSDILHAVAGNANATIIGDLTNAPQIPDNSFDCLILTQTLPVIYDIHATVQTIYRILKPGGVVLVTLSGISQISRYDMDRWGDYWRFTSRSAKQLFQEAFSEDKISVTSYGNVLAATAVLYGLVVEDLSEKEIDYSDPDYEIIITVKAIK
jgi:SAM-dependent methyltransferase